MEPRIDYKETSPNAINGWNRLAIAFRAVRGAYQCPAGAL